MIREPSADDPPVHRALPPPVRQQTVAVGLVMIPDQPWVLGERLAARVPGRGASG